MRRTSELNSWRNGHWETAYGSQKLPANKARSILGVLRHY